jgi:hypothetical protein
MVPVIEQEVDDSTRPDDGGADSLGKKGFVPALPAAGSGQAKPQKGCRGAEPWLETVKFCRW